jgi:hypothetical protein
MMLDPLNHTATQDVELVIGSDRIIRINIDGTCALRVRLQEGAALYIEDRRPKVKDAKVAWFEDWWAGKKEEL